MGGSKEPKATVKVSILIEAQIVITDSGYLGVSATVLEHIEKARQEAERWRWFVDKTGTGAGEPQQTLVRTRVSHVAIIPEEQ